MSINVCEDIRSTIIKIAKKAAEDGKNVTFTNKEFAKSLNMFDDASTPKEIEIACSIVGGELARCRSSDCNFFKESLIRHKPRKDSHRHEYMMQEENVKVTVAGYSSKYSAGGFRPAILWSVQTIGQITPKISPTVVNKVQQNFDQGPNIFKELLSKIPDKLLVEEFCRRMDH